MNKTGKMSKNTLKNDKITCVSSPVPSHGSPISEKKIKERGDNWGKIGENFARRAQHATILS